MSIYNKFAIFVVGILVLFFSVSSLLQNIQLIEYIKSTPDTIINTTSTPAPSDQDIGQNTKTDVVDVVDTSKEQKTGPEKFPDEIAPRVIVKPPETAPETNNAIIAPKTLAPEKPVEKKIEIKTIEHSMVEETDYSGKVIKKLTLYIIFENPKLTKVEEGYHMNVNLDLDTMNSQGQKFGLLSGIDFQKMDITTSYALNTGSFIINTSTDTLDKMEYTIKATARDLIGQTQDFKEIKILF